MEREPDFEIVDESDDTPVVDAEIIPPGMESSTKTKESTELDLVRQEATITMGNQIAGSYTKSVQQLCVQNNVKLSLTTSKINMLEITGKFTFEGKAKDIKTVLDTLASHSKKHKDTINSLFGNRGI